MITRRQFVGGGLGAVALGGLVKPGLARYLVPGAGAGSGPVGPSDPVMSLPRKLKSVLVDGVPFEARFTGDGFYSAGDEHIEMPPFMQRLKDADIPEPAETVKVAIVGGGISGLTSAYLLRDLEPVLFDNHERFGGNARGEHWQGTNFSLGNAYVITPDGGTFLDTIYEELGLHGAYRLSEPPDPVEIDGTVLTDFWVNGVGGDPDEIAALADYAKVVSYMADEGYPDIPYAEKDFEWIAGLDQKTLKQDIEERMSLPVPPLLESAIQGYCFSSFGAGWDRISAAGGWNFVAAEEYGRWVFPGGTSYMARALWQKLHAVERSADRPLLRSGSAVVDVRMLDTHVQITYRGRDGVLRSLLAERVIMACPKFVCKHIMHDLDSIDQPKHDAMFAIEYAPYMVVNVLLNTPLQQDFYDIFLLGDSKSPLGSYDPCGQPFILDESPVTDILNGSYTHPQARRTSVLTMYWPLMCPTARFELVFDEPWERWANRFVVQLDQLLGHLDLTRDNVVQVRMSRWGHAMPIAAPGLIAEGTIEHLRRPIDDRVYFVNQDNWALPAVENCMLDAEIMTNELRESLQ